MCMETHPRPRGSTPGGCVGRPVVDCHTREPPLMSEGCLSWGCLHCAERLCFFSLVTASHKETEEGEGGAQGCIAKQPTTLVNPEPLWLSCALRNAAA
jgi:hypothetical protein